MSQLIKIGDFSKMSKITIKALRHYDRMNILKPECINAENGYRYYTSKQLFQAGKILWLKEMGFSLEEISSLFDKELSSDYFQKMLLKKMTTLNEIIHTETKKLQKISSYIKKNEEVCVMCKVILKEIPEVIVASERKIIPNYDTLFTVVPEMGEKMRRQGAVCREPFYCFNIYHDEDYKENDIDVEICEAVVDYCKNTEGVTYKKIEKIEMAACIFHKGAYSKLANSYGEIFVWMDENGYKPIGNSRESFIDGCWNKDDPSEWLTEIQIPVSKK